ncbi:hypothetical protein D7X33_37765, partial [Butyricicoccus sp. 1XD8-22]
MIEIHNKELIEEKSVDRFIISYPHMEKRGRQQLDNLLNKELSKFKTEQEKKKDNISIQQFKDLL